MNCRTCLFFAALLAALSVGAIGPLLGQGRQVRAAPGPLSGSYDLNDTGNVPSTSAVMLWEFQGSVWVEISDPCVSGASRVFYLYGALSGVTPTSSNGATLTGVID